MRSLARRLRLRLHLSQLRLGQHADQALCRHLGLRRLGLERREQGERRRFDTRMHMQSVRDGGGARDLDPRGASIVSALQRIEMTTDDGRGPGPVTTTRRNVRRPPGLGGTEVGVQLDQIDLHLLISHRPP